jgi:hypothetical protein
MFGTTTACESFFSTMDFMKYKCRSTHSNENLVFELRCAFSIKYPGFQTFGTNKNIRTVLAILSY